MNEKQKSWFIFAFLKMSELKTKIESVIFDYGNTLILDPFPAILEMKSQEFQRQLIKCDYRITLTDLLEAWAKANREINLRFISHFCQEEIIIEQALQSLGMNGKDASKIGYELLHVYRQGFKERLSSDPRRNEIRRTLLYIKSKGLKLGVLSNERKDALDFGLTCYGVIDLFDLVLSSEELGIEKPCVEAFRQTLDLLGSSPKKSVSVGDDSINDVLAPQKIGIKTILYVPPPEFSFETSWRRYRYSEINPDFVIKDFTELEKIFDHLLL
ncbi:MAG: HAD family hydrolase [Candidatus Bathyarchaeia archaeon]